MFGFKEDSKRIENVEKRIANLENTLSDLAVELGDIRGRITRLNARVSFDVREEKKSSSMKTLVDTLAEKLQEKNLINEIEQIEEHAVPRKSE